MITNILGALANLTSLILWVPQAKTTWSNRYNLQALSGVSIGTQIIVVINTLLWCIYGVMITNIWLPLGTIIILPLAIMTILLKLQSNKNEEVDSNAWFTFAAYRKLDDIDKVRCLKAIYNTDFKNEVRIELLNWQSYEKMSDLEKMYWDKDLWIKNKDTMTVK